MNKTKVNKKGFTLLELMVSIAILMIIMMMSIIYFRKSGDSQVVRSSASALSDAIRTAQNYAQSGKIVNGQVPSAFGVAISTVSDVPMAIIYADLSSPANYVYDPATATAPDVVMGTVVLDFISLKNTRGNVTLGTGADDGIAIDGSPVGNVDLSFASPNANMRINGGTSSNQIVFSLQKGTITRTVSIDRISGRVQTSY